MSSQEEQELKTGQKGMNSTSNHQPVPHRIWLSLLATALPGRWCLNLLNSPCVRGAEVPGRSNALCAGDVTFSSARPCHVAAPETGALLGKPKSGHHLGNQNCAIKPHLVVFPSFLAFRVRSSRAAISRKGILIFKMQNYQTNPFLECPLACKHRVFENRLKKRTHFQPFFWQSFLCQNRAQWADP
jgi:hypothetical protein